MPIFQLHDFRWIRFTSQPSWLSPKRRRCESWQWNFLCTKMIKHRLVYNRFQLIQGSDPHRQPRPSSINISWLDNTFLHQKLRRLIIQQLLYIQYSILMVLIQNYLPNDLSWTYLGTESRIILRCFSSTLRDDLRRPVQPSHVCCSSHVYKQCLLTLPQRYNLWSR